jgi:hypothetical protein
MRRCTRVRMAHLPGLLALQQQTTATALTAQSAKHRLCDKHGARLIHDQTTGRARLL